MSSFLFGKMSQEDVTRRSKSSDMVEMPVRLAKRATASAKSTDADPGLAGELDEKIEESSAPPQDPSKSLVEGVLAIIPLEALTVWTVVGTQFTSTTMDPPDNIANASGNGNDMVTTITVTNENAVIAAAIGCMAIAVVAYVSGKVSAGGRYHVGKWREFSKNSLEVVRVVVPPLAFIIWAYVQRPSMLRQAIERPEPDTTWVVALTCGALLLIVAIGLGLTKPQPTPDPALDGGGGGTE